MMEYCVYIVQLSPMVTYVTIVEGEKSQAIVTGRGLLTSLWTIFSFMLVQYLPTYHAISSQSFNLYSSQF